LKADLDEFILPYEDNENWEHDVLFPLEVQEMEEDYVDLEEDYENRPTLTQTPISSYFQDGLEAPSDARSVVE
jgi:hypothetical protein